jgi:hypothetical protein
MIKINIKIKDNEYLGMEKACFLSLKDVLFIIEM